jgi:hypothetical protein
MAVWKQASGGSVPPILIGAGPDTDSINPVPQARNPVPQAQNPQMNRSQALTFKSVNNVDYKNDDSYNSNIKTNSNINNDNINNDIKIVNNTTRKESLNDKIIQLNTRAYNMTRRPTRQPVKSDIRVNILSLHLPFLYFLCLYKAGSVLTYVYREYNPLP